MMNIRPSAAIRQNYNEIADMCRKTAEPIFLTKNGEGEELLAVEEDRLHGSKGYSVSEVASMMRNAIKEVTDNGAER